MNTVPASSSNLDLLEGYLLQDPHNVLLLSDAIAEALHTGALERASVMAERALRDAPQSPEIRHLLATVRLAQGRFDEAIELLSRLHGEGLSAPAIRFNLGYALFRAGHLAEAVSMLEGLYQESPGQSQVPADTLACLMRCFHHLGAPERALTLWRQAEERFRTPEALGVASLALFDANDLVESRALADAALRSGIFSAESRIARAGICIAEGRTREAMELVQSVLERLPTDGRSWSTLGAAHLMEQDVAQAQTDYDKATRYMPRHIGSWHGLGWCQILSRDLKGARASFERALEIDRNFGESHGGLAVVDAMLGHERDAQAHIDRALRLDPQALSARFASALLSGETRDARAFERLAVRLLGARPGPLGGSVADYLPTRSPSEPLH